MTTILKVDGIMCQNCVRKVTEALKGIGVKEVSVSGDYQEVTVDQGDLELAEITKTIESIDDGKFKVVG